MLTTDTNVNTPDLPETNGRLASGELTQRRESDLSSHVLSFKASSSRYFQFKLSHSLMVWDARARATRIILVWGGSFILTWELNAHGPIRSLYHVIVSVNGAIHCISGYHAPPITIRTLEQLMYRRHSLLRETFWVFMSCLRRSYCHLDLCPIPVCLTVLYPNFQISLDWRNSLEEGCCAIL